MLYARAAVHLAVLLGCWKLCRAPERIHRYFGAMFCSATALWAIYFTLGWHSGVYRWVFLLTVLWVFSAMLELGWDCLSEIRNKGRAWLLGAACGTFLATRAALDGRHCDWMSLLDGSLDVMAVIPAAIGAMTMEGRQARIASILAITWLAGAAFQFGYTLHWGQPAWLRLNEWLPTAVTCCGALILAREVGYVDV